MAEPKEKPTIRKRTPKKATAGIFDNLRQLPHPVEEFLGLVSEAKRFDVEQTANNAPTKTSTVVQQTIVSQATVAQPLPELWSESTVAQRTTVDWQAMVEHPDQWTPLPNEIDDRIMRLIDAYEQTVLRRLYRLSWGFGSDTCRVGLQTLATACNISKKQAQRSVDKLIGRGLVERVGYDLGNRQKKERGSILRILLPRARMVRQTTVASQATVDRQATVAQRTTNKEHTLKETHTKKDVVGVGSHFSLKECRQYADSLKSEGIQNPGGYATKIHRTGEADELIERFLSSSAPAPSSAVDPSQCPDCNGSGWWYPKGPEKGIARCKHERLQA